MGTRNLTCVVVGGEYKVAQYGQWDGYPSGQGLTALNFLRGMDRDAFVQKLTQCRFIADEEQKALWVAAGADPDSDFVNMDVSNRFKAANPQLSRDAGAEVLQLIQSANGEILLGDSITFADDSLFCEYAYVVDLDKNTFECFKGFNQSPMADGERFADLPKPERSNCYSPVKLFHTFDLAALPTEEEFLAICEPREEDEDE